MNRYPKRTSESDPMYLDGWSSRVKEDDTHIRNRRIAVSDKMILDFAEFCLQTSKTFPGLTAEAAITKFRELLAAGKN